VPAKSSVDIPQWWNSVKLDKLIRSLLMGKLWWKGMSAGAHQSAR
jgi:hypothetical protein